MMSAMQPLLLGIPAIAVMLWIFVTGLSAPRTRKLALFGMVPAGCAFGALLWSALNPEVALVARFAASLAAIAGGTAHAVWVSILALPRNKVWLRLLFVPMGLWAGATLSLWFVLPASGIVLEVCLLILLSATVTSWFLLPWYGRRPEYVALGSRKLPCVRFACPRCGTRVDWAHGIFACTDCGLFLHVEWPAPERESRPAAVLAVKSVKFACPGCGKAREWKRGEDQCEHCGLKVELHWNEHVGTKPAAPADPAKPK
jgi:predicted RNA-binding Zn-ribbon protein involved in translation (DUF1610 family)